MDGRRCPTTKELETLAGALEMRAGAAADEGGMPRSGAGESVAARPWKRCSTAALPLTVESSVKGPDCVPGSGEVLDQAVGEDLFEHLEQCPTCREQVDSLRQDAAAARELRAASLDEVPTAIRRRLLLRCRQVMKEAAREF